MQVFASKLANRQTPAIYTAHTPEHRRMFRRCWSLGRWPVESIEDTYAAMNTFIYTHEALRLVLRNSQQSRATQGTSSHLECSETNSTRKNIISCSCYYFGRPPATVHTLFRPWVLTSPKNEIFEFKQDRSSSKVFSVAPDPSTLSWPRSKSYVTFKFTPIGGRVKNARSTST